MPTTTGALSAGPTEVSRSRFEGRSTLHLHRAVWGHPEGPAGERDRARRPSFYVEMIPTQANRPEIICSVRDLAVPLNLVRTCPEKEEGKEKRERGGRGGGGHPAPFSALRPGSQRGSVTKV